MSVCICDRTKRPKKKKTNSNCWSYRQTHSSQNRGNNKDNVYKLNSHSQCASYFLFILYSLVDVYTLVISSKWRSFSCTKIYQSVLNSVYFGVCLKKTHERMKENKQTKTIHFKWMKSYEKKEYHTHRKTFHDMCEHC